MVPFTQLSHEDGIINRIQDQVFRALQFVASNFLPVINIVEQSVGTGDTAVYHGLNRPPRGRIIVGLSADARVWDGSTSSSPGSYVNLKASATVVVRLIFF